MAGLYTGATGLWGGFTGLLYGSSALSTPPGLLADAGWSPAQLFAQGEQGVWYQPSDFSTMFQDSVGTTPVTAVEQPVGLILDKSKGLALGAELVTNGDFSSNTWWSTGGGAAISGGALNFTAAVATSGAYRLGFATVGKYYELTFEIISISSGGIQITLGNSSGTNRTAAGVYTQRILCTGNTNLTLYSVGASTTASVDNVSIKEVQGNHASQSTTTSRPVLSARVNLLTYSENLAVSLPWSGLYFTATGSAGIAPNGTNTATQLECSANNSPYRTQVFSAAVATYTASFYVKAVNQNFVAINFSDGVAFNYYVSFNLATNTVIRKDAQISGETITAVGNDWYLIKASLAYASAAAGANVGLFFVDATGLKNAIAVGQKALVWGADLRPTNQVNAGMPNYQRIADANTYDTSGFPYYLKFDGGDSLSTATINPGSVDKAQVFAGVRKLNDNAYQILCEFSATVTSNNGSFATLATSGAASGATGKNALNTGLRGTALASYDLTTFTPPITYVASNLFDIGGDTISSEIVPRVNGVSPTLTVVGAGPAGTGNFGSYPLYIGARAGSSLYFNGNLYGLIVRFSSTNLPNSTILQVEDWMDVQTFGEDLALVYSDELTTALGELITAADGDQIYMTVSYV